MRTSVGAEFPPAYAEIHPAAARYAQAIVRALQGDLSTAMRDLADVAQLALPGVLTLARLQVESGDVESATRVLDEISDQSGGLAARKLRAEIELHAGRPAEAASLVECCPEPEQLGPLGRVLLDAYIALGREEEAIAHAERMLREDAQDAAFKAALVRLYARARRYGPLNALLSRIPVTEMTPQDEMLFYLVLSRIMLDQNACARMAYDMLRSHVAPDNRYLLLIAQTSAGDLLAREL